MMTKMLIGVLATAGIALGVAPMAQAQCCEDEFAWADPYADALHNHGLSHVIADRGIMAGMAAEAICKGSSPLGIASEYNFGLATAEQIARAVYLDVCPEMES